MLLSAATLGKIYDFHGRYLDPAFFMYGDELELGHAMQRAGQQAWVAERVVVSHREHGSSDRSGNRLFQYYSRRNTILLARRLLPFWSRWPFHVWCLVVTARRIAENLLCRRPQSARAVAWGWLDGYRSVEGKWREHDRQWQRANPEFSPRFQSSDGRAGP
jgi:GT2 family glycosyltransferase